MAAPDKRQIVRNEFGSLQDLDAQVLNQQLGLQNIKHKGDKSLQCPKCSEQCYPYCLNPDDIIWMCSSDECDFPFAESKEHVSEVCYFIPNLSQTSLISQVHYIQEGKADNSKEQGYLNPEFSEHISKVRSFLSNYQQNCGPSCGCPTALAEQQREECFIPLDDDMGIKPIEDNNYPFHCSYNSQSVQTHGSEYNSTLGWRKEAALDWSNKVFDHLMINI